MSAQVGRAEPAFGANLAAWVFAATAGYGFASSHRETLIVSSTLTGRIENGTPENAVLAGSFHYYHKQSESLLFYAGIDAAAGRNLDLDNQILLGGDNGLRGYPLRYQDGTSRALLTFEERYFTDWYPFRLARVGGAVFADLGRTWGSGVIGNSDPGLLKDVGFGLRLGNSRSGLGNIIHVDLAFPLDGDATIHRVQILVVTKATF